MNPEKDGRGDIAALTEAELEAVAGGGNYILGDSGQSYIHPSPDRESRRLGTLKQGESVQFLGRTATDDRGVVWYKIRWNGRDAWVSSKYTRKVHG